MNAEIQPTKEFYLPILTPGISFLPVVLCFEVWLSDFRFEIVI